MCLVDYKSFCPLNDGRPSAAIGLEVIRGRYAGCERIAMLILWNHGIYSLYWADQSQHRAQMDHWRRMQGADHIYCDSVHELFAGGWSWVAALLLDSEEEGSDFRDKLRSL